MKKPVLPICVRTDTAHFLNLLNYWPTEWFHMGLCPLLAAVFVQIVSEALCNENIIGTVILGIWESKMTTFHPQSPLIKELHSD